jgi:ankyrin repeat protein
MPSVFRTGVLATLLGLSLLAPAPAWAQATSNTSLNAQLLVAARQSDLPAVQQALARGASPDSRNRLGKTVLLIAAERGDLAMATAAMAAGADVNLASINRVTPLMAASYAGQVDLVKALLAAGAQVDLQDHLHKPAIVYVSRPV